MNNKGFIALVIVILISVMAVGLVGAAWYYEANKNDTVIEKTNTVSPVNTNISTNTNTITNTLTNTTTNTVVNTNTAGVDTSDWQTYENEEYGYSIQFPSDWYTSTQPAPSFPTDGVTEQIYITNYNPNDEGGGSLASNQVNYIIKVFENSSNFTAVEFVESIKQKSSDYSSVITSEQSAVVFGINAYQVNWSGLGSGIESYFPNQNYMFEIDGIGEISLYEEILSTFQFLPDTADWQTYESDTFSLQFPSNWTLGTSTFKDENQNKIAELSPGIIKLSEIGSCKEQPLPIKPQTGEPVEALIQENITIDGLVGVKTVWYTITAGDTGSSWYPNRYCIQNDNIAFVMNFYEKELGTGDRDLFEDILATLQFTN